MMMMRRRSFSKLVIYSPIEVEDAIQVIDEVIQQPIFDEEFLSYIHTSVRKLHTRR